MSARSHDVGVVAFARRHGVFLCLLLLGIAVRAVVMVAYRPAMMFTDSIGYIARAQDLTLSVYRPSGYSFFLRLTQTFSDSLALVAALQHLMGLLVAVTCYAFLTRRGVPRWGAAVATLPLLLDPLQLVLEHYVLSDVLFEALLVAACLALLWRHRPTPATALAVGTLVAGAGLVRGAGVFLVLVFLVALLCLRPRWTAVVTFLVGAAVPLAAYAAVFQQQHGDFALAKEGPRFLYARLAPIVPCANLPMPRYERQLCPPEPVGSRPHTNAYMWGQHKAAQWNLRLPRGLRPVDVVKDFDKRVVRAHPVVYARAVLADAARGFAPVRTYDVAGYPSSYWLFDDHYWSTDTFPGLRDKLASGRYGVPTHDPAAAEVMTTYRHWVFTPGPLLAALLLVALAATFGLGRARLSGHRVAVGLLTASCLMPLLTAAALSGFSWRYQLPQLALLPTAAALGIWALLRGRQGGPEPSPPLRVLDRAAAWIGRLPLPRAWRPAYDRAVTRGWPQVALGLLAATVGGLLVHLLAMASGWAAPRTAAALGVLAGTAALVMLLVAWRRSAADAVP